MKRIKILWLPLLLLAVTSCDRDDLGDNGNDGGKTTPGNIKFEFGFAPQTRAATDTGFNTTWEEGDEIGLFAVPSGEELDYDLCDAVNINNVKLTYQNGAWSGPAYWPQDGTAIDFYAYYPYDENVDDPFEIHFAVKTDQRERGGHNLSDLMAAWSDNGGRGYSLHSEGEEAVSLQFSHALAMVQLTLDDEYGALDLSKEINVNLRGFFHTGPLYLGFLKLFDEGYNFFGVYYDIEPTDITMYRVEQPGTPEFMETFTFRALVPAQSKLTDAVIFRITNGDLILDGSALTGNIILESGRVDKFTQKIPISVLTPQPYSNSYMVTPGGRSLLIPVEHANRVLTWESLEADITGLDEVRADYYNVELVWADTPIGPGGVIIEAVPETIDGEGYIRVKPGIAGNAVIGIKIDDEPTFRWSWHIWVTDEVGYATDNVTGLTWMDRNLGAAGTSYDANGRNGLFYQWGRKDAFPASDGTDNNQLYYTPAAPGGTSADLPTGSYTELPDMVANPLTFATNYGTYLGSVNVDSDNDSWGGISGAKTIYDPCPCGWKMPPIEANGHNSWGNDYPTDWGAFPGQGRVFNGVDGTASLGHFYPNVGCRDYADASLYDVGTIGCYWSASPIDLWGFSYFLFFNSMNMAPNSDDFRASGFSVRCVKE